MSKKRDISIPVNASLSFEQIYEAVRQSGFAQKRWTSGEADYVDKMIELLWTYRINDRFNDRVRKNWVGIWFECSPDLVIPAIESVLRSEDAEGWIDDPRECQDYARRLRAVADRLDRRAAELERAG